MTPEERKEKVNLLRKDHEDYLEHIPNALFIPKMAYRPKDKDELHISFFPSELSKEQDIYTEFVSINIESEDPKRTLYLLKHNPFWKEEYETIVSSRGFETHIVPVSELKPVKDITEKNSKVAEKVLNLNEIPDPGSIKYDTKSIVLVLTRIAESLEKINSKL